MKIILSLSIVWSLLATTASASSSFRRGNGRPEEKVNEAIAPLVSDLQEQRKLAGYYTPYTYSYKYKYPYQYSYNYKYPYQSTYSYDNYKYPYQTTSSYDYHDSYDPYDDYSEYSDTTYSYDSNNPYVPYDYYSEYSDIPTTAIENGMFETLVAALSAADLVGALSSPNGPFTVFAPTDDAFAALPAGLLDCLLYDIPTLTDILLYHVAEGRVVSSQLKEGMTIPTLEGSSVTVSLYGGVYINDSGVIMPDVYASNGVIHVIDSVLVPPYVDVDAYLYQCYGDQSHDHGAKYKKPHGSNYQYSQSYYYSSQSF